MTLNLKPGDRVVFNDKYYVSEEYKGRTFTVCSEPWMCCGTLIVSLKGLSGGFAVDGLKYVWRCYGYGYAQDT